MLKAKDKKQIHEYQMNRVRADAPNEYALLVEAFKRIRKLEIKAEKQHKRISGLEGQVRVVFAEAKRSKHEAES